MQITLVLPYYENGGMLREYYKLMRSLPDVMRSRINLIVVDDGSPKEPAFVEDLGGMALQLYRADVDIRWNQDFCRNVGVHHAETSWVLLTDIDHLVPEKTWEYLLKGKWDSGMAYKFNRVSAPDMSPYKPHPNSWFMTTKLYNKAGGYDERFAGYYGTDWDFRNRIEKVTEKVGLIKAHIIRVPRTVIPDASTTTYLRKQPEDRVNIARIKEEREATKWRTLRLTFPYHRVFP